MRTPRSAIDAGKGPPWPDMAMVRSEDTDPAPGTPMDEAVRATHELLQAAAGRGGESAPEPPGGTSAPLPESGTILAGRYQVGALLGSGGMGLVFTGRDLQTGADIVLKTPHPGCSHEVLRRFIREANLRFPPHPALASIRRRLAVRGRPWLVQERIPGRSLAAILQARLQGERPSGGAEEPWFDPEQALHTAVRGMACVARGVALLHEYGILHRDLKPGNLVLHPSGRVVLVDFGLAAGPAADELTRRGQVLGSTAYMAPEQARGRRADERADLYALGATLWHLLTGELPADSSQAPRLWGSPRPVPAALLEILRRALEPQRRFRYRSARALAEDLEAWLSSPGGGRSTSVTTRARRWLTRRRFEIAVGLAVVALAASGFLVRAWWEARVEAASARWTGASGRAAAAGGRVQALVQRSAGPAGPSPEVLLEDLQPILVLDPEMSRPETREARRNALELLLAMGQPEQARLLVESLAPVGPDWADFEDFRLQAGVLSACGRYEEASLLLARAVGLWPGTAPLVEQVRDVLARFAAALPAEHPWQGTIHDAAGEHLPMYADVEGGLHAWWLGAEGALSSRRISPAGSFLDAQAWSGCLVRIQGEPAGYLLTRRILSGRDEEEESGLYWQSMDPTEQPRQVFAMPPERGIQDPPGLAAADLDGDGTDEVLVPYGHSFASTLLLRRERGGWRASWLPVEGNDVQALALVGSGSGAGRIWLGTAWWNQANQGYRLQVMDYDPVAGSLQRRLSLPLGALFRWQPLRGWPAHSLASFAFLEDPQLFGTRHRSARSGELWLLAEHPGHGLCLDRRLWRTPSPVGLGQTNIDAGAADLDANGRDEIYWAWRWRTATGASVAVSDGEGGTLVLPLESHEDEWIRALHFGDGPRDVLLRRNAKGETWIVAGAAGVEPPAVPRLQGDAPERILLVRGEGAAWGGEFQVPEDWRPGQAGTWVDGGFRVVRSDFDAGGWFVLESAEGGTGDPQEGLVLACQGGGSSFLHLAGRLVRDRIGYLDSGDAPYHWCLGAWNRLRVGPDATGETLLITLEKEEAEDDASASSLSVRIGIRPVPGQVLRWRWAPLPVRLGMEVRDRQAVLALEWAGDGGRPPGGFARTDVIRATVSLGAALEDAARAGDRERYEELRQGLRKLCPLPRVATSSGQERNGLACYYLEESRVVLLEASGQGRVVGAGEKAAREQ